MPPRKCSVSDLACTVIDEGRIQLLDCVGRGSFGAVYRARDLTGQNPSLLAVKIVPKDSKLQYHWREVSTLHRAQHHSNVVTMHRWFHDQTCIYIVLDYCPGGDMWRAIKDRKIFAGNDSLVKNIFLQIIDGVRWCHRRGVYHRDLKPNNILISPDCTKVWISDFGLATSTRRSFNFHTGTQQYRSPGEGFCTLCNYLTLNIRVHRLPECNNISGEHYPYDAVRNDIWSLGIILVNMLTGVMPWAVANQEDGWYMAYAGDHKFLRYTLPISKEVDYILQRIFTENSEDAITLVELQILVENVRHFWMDEEEIAAGEPHLQRVARNYRVDEPIDMPVVNSWDYDSAYDSLLDDSDDSDEHSIGLHTPSLCALEEGRLRSRGSTHLEDGERVKVDPGASQYVPPSKLVVPIRPLTQEVEDERTPVKLSQRAPIHHKPTSSSPSATSTTNDSGDTSGQSEYSGEAVRGKKSSRWSLRRQLRRLFPVRV